MNYYVHTVPGRLRVKSPAARQRPDRAAHIQQILEINGVDKTTVNTVTGSIVIEYDPVRTDSKTILTILEENRYFDTARATTGNGPTHPSSSFEKTRVKVGKALCGWALGRALEANGLSFIAAFI